MFNFGAGKQKPGIGPDGSRIAKRTGLINRDSIIEPGTIIGLPNCYFNMFFHKIIYLLFLLCFGYCALSVGYLFLFSLSGRLFFRKRKDPQVPDAQKRSFAVLVPAYREDGIILSTAKNLLQQDYPADKYRVFIIADSFKPETIVELKQLPLTVLEVAFDKSTKTKSLNEAFSRIPDRYDIALICDADNMMAPNFLRLVDAAFAGGARAVQGRRVAKNLDTSFAILDACSEAINNHIFRKGPYALGLSSSVIGSGMSFEYDRIKKILSEISAVGGFDKILQLQVVGSGVRIHYLEDALVFDEKVDSSEAFQQQRKRWVSSQFIYLKRFFLPAFGKLFRGNLSYFNLAVASNLVLPRAFLFVLLPLLVAGGFLFSLSWGLIALGLGLLYFITLLLGVPSQLFNKDLLVAIGRLPKAIFVMVGALFQIKKSNQTFIHTVHTKTEVSNTLYKDSTKQ